MGGFGSGNRNPRRHKRVTLEESLSIGIRDFRKRLFPHSRGSITWTWAGNECSVGYFITWDGNWPTLTLRYVWRDQENISVAIRLHTTPTNFNGERWWFVCPLIVDGAACKRRVGRLYLPPGAQFWGCRLCHDLAYQSTRETHRADRLRPGRQA